jgi:hypothetical protein
MGLYLDTLVRLQPSAGSIAKNAVNSRGVFGRAADRRRNRRPGMPKPWHKNFYNTF